MRLSLQGCKFGMFLFRKKNVVQWWRHKCTFFAFFLFRTKLTRTLVYLRKVNKACLPRNILIFGSLWLDYHWWLFRKAICLHLIQTERMFHSISLPFSEHSYFPFCKYFHFKRSFPEGGVERVNSWEKQCATAGNMFSSLSDKKGHATVYLGGCSSSRINWVNTFQYMSNRYILREQGNVIGMRYFSSYSSIVWALLLSTNH